MADKISIIELPKAFPEDTRVWEDVKEQLKSAPMKFFLETILIISECLFDHERLFKPTHVGTVNEPRPTVYLLTCQLIAPPYLTALYMAPFDAVRGRSTIMIHPEEGQSIDSYVNRFEEKLRSETEYKIKVKERSGKKQLVIVGPAGYNWLDESSDEIDISPKPYDVSKDDRIGKTDFDIKSYDPDSDQDGGPLMG